MGCVKVYVVGSVTVGVQSRPPISGAEAERAKCVTFHLFSSQRRLVPHALPHLREQRI